MQKNYPAPVVVRSRAFSYKGSTKNLLTGEICMKWYTVSYDLNSPGQDYSKLIAKIQAIANGYCNALKSFWIIGHPGNAKAIFDQLHPLLDNNDYLFVSELTRDNWWFLRKDNAEWFNKNVKFY
jgi:hypothetical protein